MKLSKLFIAILALGLGACGANNTSTQNANGQGYYDQNGSWVQTGYNQTYGNGSCIPLQNGALAFSVQGASVNSAVILAGLLPANSTHPGQWGQVTMGGAIQQGLYGALTLTKQSSVGNLQLSLANTSAMSGYIQLSQTGLAYVQQMSGGMQTQQYPYNNYNMYSSNLCVTSIAIDAVYSAVSYQGIIQQALVYFYVNGSQQPIGPIPFY